MPKDRIYGLLESSVGVGNVSDELHALQCYSCDSTTNPPSLPDYVVIATTAEQTQRLVRLANKEKIPIVPVVGMSNTGGLTIPVEGGIILDLHKMNEIIEINEDIDYAIIEPGVTIGQLDTELKKRGYWVSLPVGPPGSAGLLPGYILHGYGHLGGKLENLSISAVCVETVGSAAQTTCPFALPERGLALMSTTPEVRQ